MSRREDADKFADGVVGSGFAQQVVLVCPTHRQLVACHLHPNAVYTILRDNCYGGYHKLVQTSDPLAVALSRNAFAHVHWALVQQHQRVPANNEVIPYGIMVAICEVDAVTHSLWQLLPAVGECCGAIIAGCQKK